MARHLLTLLFICISFHTQAQQYVLRGNITNTKREPLPFATVQIKELQINLQAKQDGSYEVFLPEGKFDIIVSMTGYKRQIVTVIISKQDLRQDVLMEEDKTRQEEDVTIVGQRKDRAEEYIRNVIRHKDVLQNRMRNWSVTLYIKATEEVNGRKQKTKPPPAGMPVPDSATQALSRMSMAEIQLHLDRQLPNGIKETRNAVKKRGNPESLFYLSTVDGDFNLYDNLLRIPAISKTPFVSPFSYSGLIAYRYKTLRTIKRGDRNYHTISFKPGKLGNALLSGEVEIVDSAWAIIKASYSLPAYHLNEYDRFEAEQQYQVLQDSIWAPEKMRFSYMAKEGKRSRSGNTTVYFTGYEPNKLFPKKHFGLELSSTSREAYERDSAYWQALRPEPLTDKELRFIRYKDSVYQATNTKHYLDSIDSLTNRITFKKVAIEGITFYNRKKEQRIEIAPVTNLYEPFQPGGARISYYAGYNKTFKDKKTFTGFIDLSYGIRNKDMNGRINVGRLYNPFNRGYLTVNAGRSFDYLFEGDVLINSFRKKNIYRKYHLSVAHNFELLNGLFLENQLELAYRQSLVGMQFFDWNKLLNDITKDSADAARINETNTPIDFKAHSVFYNNIKLSYTPFQRYMREPDQKVILGSKWPTFSILWRKGIPGLLGSVVDYDYVEGRIAQEIQFGTAGQSRYSLVFGNFLNRTNIQQADKKFIRGRDPYLFLSPDFAFQHIDSTFELRKNFLEGHYVHEFNGAILNKIPLLKKLKLREVAGGGLLYAPERNLRYFEYFAGIESPVIKIFRERFKLGLFAVGSFSNQFRNPIQLKISIRQWDRVNNRWN
jgi:hypothetical protein